MRGMKHFLLIIAMEGCAATPRPPSIPSQKTEHTFPNVAKLPFQKGLPDPFLMPNGKRVSTPRDWRRQRQYLKAMLSNYMYGRMPPRPKEIEIKQTGSKRVSEGQGVEERYTLTIRRNGKSVTCGFLFTRPAFHHSEGGHGAGTGRRTPGERLLVPIDRGQAVALRRLVPRKPGILQPLHRGPKELQETVWPLETQRAPDHQLPGIDGTTGHRRPYLLAHRDRNHRLLRPKEEISASRQKAGLHRTGTFRI